MSEQFIIGFSTAILIGITIFAILQGRWNKEKIIIMENHNRFVHIVENSKDFIYYCNVYPEIKYEYLSPSAEYYFGKGSIERAFLNPDIPFIDIHPDDKDTLLKKVSGEMDYKKSIIQRWKDKDGKYRWFEEYATPIYENGRVVALQGVLRNIDEKIELHERLQYRLNHDILTDIYNREYFEMIFTKFNEKVNASVAIILCDLDDLKYTNDNFGHKMGDALIKNTAKLLNQFSSDTITFARIGGDEFVFIVKDKAKEKVKQLLNSISKEIKKNNRDCNDKKIKISIGYAYSANSIGRMTELFSRADKKMYQNKNKKKQMKHLVGR